MRNATAAVFALPLLAVAGLLSSLTSQLAQRLLLAVVFFDLPIQLETIRNERMEAAEFGGLAGYGISLTTVALALLYLRWMLPTLAARQPLRPPARVSIPLLAYLGVAVVTAIAALDPSLSLRELFVFLHGLLIYVYLVTWTRTREDVGFVMAMLFLSLALQSLVMMYGIRLGATSSLFGPVKIIVWTDEWGGGMLRTGGTVGSPNGAAAFLTVLLAPAVAVLLTPVRLPIKALVAGAAGLGAVALILTGSRGGWAATLLSLVILWACTARFDGRWLAAIVVSIGALTVVAFTAQSTIADRLTRDDQGSAESRGPLMQTALKIIRDHPVLGVGPNNYGTAMRQYGAVYGRWGNWVYTVHNKFLLVWAETGPAGLLAFLWFLAETLRLGWKGWKASDPWLSPLALGFVAALVGHILHMQVDLFNARPFVEMLFIVAALVRVMHVVSMTERRQSEAAMVARAVPAR